MKYEVYHTFGDFEVYLTLLEVLPLKFIPTSTLQSLRFAWQEFHECLVKGCAFWAMDWHWPCIGQHSSLQQVLRSHTPEQQIKKRLTGPYVLMLSQRLARVQNSQAGQKSRPVLPWTFPQLSCRNHHEHLLGSFRPSLVQVTSQL